LPLIEDAVQIDNRIILTIPKGYSGEIKKEHEKLTKKLKVVI